MAEKRKHSIFEIQPIKTSGVKEDKRPVKGAELLPELYASVVCAAPTSGGKTTVIGHVLKHCIDERTKVIVFCSTWDLDVGWRGIKQDLERREIEVAHFDSVVDDQKHDVLKTVVDQVGAEMSSSKPRAKKRKQGVLQFLLEDEDEEEDEPDKHKDRVPEHCFILDDLTVHELQHNSVVNLLKKSRHYKAKVIVSTQAIIHLVKSAWAQLSELCLFGGFAEDYLRLLYKRIPTHVPYSAFELAYNEVTSEKHRFLTIYLRTGEWRVNLGPLKIDITALQ
jgi:hypothetical protein